MFESYVEEILKFFDSNKYEQVQAGSVALIQEKSDTGKVSLECCMKGNAIVFNDADKSVLNYLSDVKGARACADTFIFEQSEDGKWILHIIEFKKTINVSSIAKAKWQLKMGICNAKAVAAFIGIDLKEIKLYSGFRKDEISDLGTSSLISLRVGNIGVKERMLWMSDQWVMDVGGSRQAYRHHKIYLDADGRGRIEL